MANFIWMEMRRLILLLCILCTNAIAEQLPIDAFGKLPQAENFVLSPDGSKVAYTVNMDSNVLIGVKDFKTNKARYIIKTDNQKFKVGWYVWANNELLLVSSDYPVFQKGVAYKESRLLKVNVTEKQKRFDPAITPKISNTYNKKDEHNSQFQNNIIDILPDDPNHILMSVDLDIPNTPSVYKVDLRKKKARQRIQRGKNNITSWMTDRQHNVRLAIGRDETRIFYKIKNLDTDKWEELWSYEIFNAPNITPLGFALDPSILYFRADNKGRYAVFKINVNKKGAKRILVYSNDEYDVNGSLIYSTLTNDVVGVTGFVNKDKDITKLKKGLDLAIPDANNTIVSLSRDHRKYVLYSSSGKAPGAFFVGDRDKGGLDFLAEEYPALYNKALSGKKLISYKARDGLTIEGYVTAPHGGFKKETPAIVLPHGGPMSRDNASFDWLTEFLANRGYAVIQPNFRGSSGYGFKFQMESIKSWGGSMQDDIEDAAHWLIENYTVDKNRICVLGASYGGYAAMMAAAKQKKTFSCAVSFAGVADLELMMKKAKNFTNYQVVKRQIGNDSDLLEKNSPITHAKNINVPILLIHGDKDRVVSVEQSRDMFSKLEGHDKTVEYVELKNGDHYMSIEGNRLKTLDSIDKFLKKYN